LVVKQHTKTLSIMTNTSGVVSRLLVGGSRAARVKSIICSMLAVGVPSVLQYPVQ
jgi:hypothetical protein